MYFDVPIMMCAGGEPANRIALSNYSSVVAVASNDKTVKLFDPSGKQVAEVCTWYCSDV